MTICARQNEFDVKRFGAATWRADDRSCSYCGSMNADDFMQRLEQGDVELGSTDKNYKVYVHNAGGVAFKQSYRDCPRDANCTGPDDCGHWVTREIQDGKFYFYHLSEAQQTRFIELYNAGKIRMAGGFGFYVLPFFCKPVVAK
jgi:hypothetical protein